MSLTSAQLRKISLIQREFVYDKLLRSHKSAFDEGSIDMEWETPECCRASHYIFTWHFT